MRRSVSCSLFDGIVGSAVHEIMHLSLGHSLGATAFLGVFMAHGKEFALFFTRCGNSEHPPTLPILPALVGRDRIGDDSLGRVHSSYLARMSHRL